jgi:hypothetical protein
MCMKSENASAAETTKDGICKCVLQATAYGLACGMFIGLFFGTIIVVTALAWKIVELIR